MAQLVDKFAGTDADHGDLHVVTRCLVGFPGFLRFNELSALKESDVQIFPDHMEIFIASSEIDQYRQGMGNNSTYWSKDLPCQDDSALCYPRRGRCLPRPLLVSWQYTTYLVHTGQHN